MEVKFSIPLYSHQFEDNWLKSVRKVAEKTSKIEITPRFSCSRPLKGGREVEDKNLLPPLERLLNKEIFSDLVEVEEKYSKIPWKFERFFVSLQSQTIIHVKTSDYVRDYQTESDAD